MIARLYFIGGSAFVSGCFLFHIFYTDLLPDYRKAIYFIIESIVILYPMFLCPICLTSSRKACKTNISPLIVDSDVYFKQLKNSWN
ncbi:unnamed protein product [Caenorhabditis angaria]|uniref:Uncharacterized protein n=1 Tax=Caenorhabditis angaria TaxID=860376 RepID=A0A9P1IDU5_9PELO|nr:unnamed protein product [Caenorhabditis angaria]